MRPVLIRLLLDRPWAFWVSDVEGVPGIGAAVVWSLLGGLGLIWWLWQRKGSWTGEDRANVILWGLVAAGLTFLAPRLSIDNVPIFGYGLMVLTGFLTATWLGQMRARQAGLNPSVVFDATFWTLIFGVLGGRLFYLIQHGDRVFVNVNSLWDYVRAAVDLSSGGLVLIGSMFGGAVGYFLASRRKGFAPLPLLDLLTPSIFVAIGFGRIGCFLYGCCFGDPSTLPWAVEFPPGSAAFQALAARGFVAPDAPACIPLHPTQLYSAFDGFLLALVTYAYHPYRAYAGGTFALGMILYPITRFFIEYLRSDELGAWGTRFTISQWLSLGLFLAGLTLAACLSRHSRRRSPNHEPPAG